MKQPHRLERILSGLPTHGAEVQIQETTIRAYDKGVIKDTDNLLHNVVSQILHHHMPDVQPPLNAYEDTDRYHAVRELAAQSIDAFMADRFLITDEIV